MKTCYKHTQFAQSSLDLIRHANAIIADYQAQGYTLTLRQLYYQFVSRDLLPNTQKSYNRLGSVISDARLSGLVDWDAIEDRTRNLRGLTHWNDPKDIIRACAEQYRVDLWEGQPCHVEVWVEKEALAGVVERAASELDVSWFCCRGYTSQSEMESAARRLVQKSKQRKRVTIIHLGDHDPSGVDMTRDIEERLELFTGYWGVTAPTVKRIALNMDQVEEYSPPPNPAKITDSRAGAYIAKHGDSSWELDALEPSVLNDLIRANIEPLIDKERMEVQREKILQGREWLTDLCSE